MLGGLRQHEHGQVHEVPQEAEPEAGVGEVAVRKLKGSAVAA